jgi:hypothetical protein
MELKIDTEARLPMQGPFEFYNADGLAVCMFNGNKGDYLDLNLPRCEHASEMPYTPLYIAGAWLQVDAATGAAWVSDNDHPWGHQDGVSFEARTGGMVRSYCTQDGTNRVCGYPVDPQTGVRDFAPIERKHTLGKAGPFVVPKGGIFILAIGSVTVNGQTFKAPHVIAAKSGDVTLQIASGVYGAALWRI